MKIKINKWIEIEASNGNAINLTYEEAKELYLKLHQEFGGVTNTPQPLFSRDLYKTGSESVAKTMTDKQFESTVTGRGDNEFIF